MSAVSFRVAGIPAAQGSLRTFVRNGKAITTSDSKRLADWRAAIAAQAQRAMGDRPVVREAVVVTAVFNQLRPKSHFSAKGELRRSAPRYVAKRPDLDKLARALLDAITGIVIADDAQVVVLEVRKVYSHGAGAYVRIEVLP